MNTLIKRCLAYGITILPIQLNGILDKYEQYKIPDNDLNKLNKDQVQKYVKGLLYSGFESARDWDYGHNLLCELGFKRVERNVGFRVYINLEYINRGD